jgi:hypothetical protein
MCIRAEAVEGAVAAEPEQLERPVPLRSRSTQMVWFHRQTAAALVSGSELPRRTMRAATSAFQQALCFPALRQRAALTLVLQTMPAVWTAQALATMSTLPSVSPAPSSRPRPKGL